MGTRVETKAREQSRVTQNSTQEKDAPPKATGNTPPRAVIPGVADEVSVPVRTRRGRRIGVNASIGLLTLVVLVGVWWAVAVIGNYPPYILPTPPAVAERLGSMLVDGTLAKHFWTTIMEAGLGFLLASVVGITLGYVIAHSHMLERLASPYIAISQALPVVAIAPLLIIWVRDDLTRKVIIVALIVFFPILVNTIVGIRGIDRSMLEVARISGANRIQTIRYVEMPLSLRAILGGIKLGLTLSITGAVIAEFVAPRSGLGFLLVLGQNMFDTTMIFVGLVSLAFLAVLTYVGVTILERRLITWE